ncbi:NACHT domain-containing NTPase [Streptomyces sp. BK340]|uniref:NACHT domain-containing protein n=1 Tax=Streptomyces sp. BK340 TaxID=2572903 RepID=UPI0011A5FA67|nr:NACHT domain-containing protein [Streptomyces sp. BK340]TVZ95112.1 NACHT domain-containing protein [Streptomyces sp. BK340]
MTGVRRALRILAGAGLLVTVGVATNQVLNDGRLSWTWLYASLCVSALSLVYSELGTASVPAEGENTGPARGGRRVYLRQLRASVQDMETVGIATQGEFVFRMRQVYVDVSVVPQPLHAAAREPYLGSVGGGERRSLASVLRDAEHDEASRVLAVIGGPGSGKTTLARNTALELCAHRWRPWKRRLPVLLYLRDHATALLADEPPTLETVAVSAGWLDGKVPARWLASQLDRGGCVVMLDGLDEVADPAERGRVVAWVARQIQRHPHNTYVVTSRPHGYESNPLPGAEVLQVRRFTWQQIERFLRQWSYATESRARGGTGHEVRAAAVRTATDLLARLRRQAALYDLAANPLLLTMTANVHRYRGQLPGSRAELYAEMCDVLLHRRSEARGLTDATGLTGPHKQHVAQHLALAMMKARVRDWPVRDAARAIRVALRQVPGQVTAEVFLGVARKSGLLVERDHDVYGFAHLTLQEYLAAAQLGVPHADTAVLTANVDDPWWRETILLWSAGNDATPVITACLDSGTVPALALAFDCAEEARTVDPDVRGRLEALLAPPEPGRPRDPARARLVAGILATRALRETIRIDDTTALCARPVPHSLYMAFVSEEEAAGRHHPVLPDPAGSDSGVAVGMQAGDAERFVDWINTLTGDGETAYRLPAPAELGDAAALAADLTRHTVWAHDGTETFLHQPQGVDWPYTYPAAQLRPLVAADRERITLYLRLMATPEPQRTQVEAWTKVLTTALTHASALRRAPALSALKLPLVLAMAIAIDDVRRCAEAFTDNRELGPAFLRAFDLAHAFTRAVGTVPVQELSLNLDPVLARALEHAHSVVGAHAPEILDPGISLDRVQELALGLAIDPTLGRALPHAYRLDLDRALEHARGLDESLIRTLGLALESADVPAPAPDLVRAVDRALSRSLSHPFLRDPNLDLALNLALSLTRDSHTQVLTLSLNVFRSLCGRDFPGWPLAADDDAEAPGLDALDDVLVARATEGWLATGRPVARATEDPAGRLRFQRNILRSTATDFPARQAQVLLEDTTALLTAIRDRTVPCDARALSSVRTALIAATLDLDESGWRHQGRSGHMYTVWKSLAALDASSNGPRPNQILLLIRTQP